MAPPSLHAFARVLAALAFLSACGSEAGSSGDGTADSSVDASPPDASTADAPTADRSTADRPTPDAPGFDAPRSDGPAPDAPAPDVAAPDASAPDALAPDAPDASAPDAPSVPDAPTPLGDVRLELHALDLWAQPLPSEGRLLEVQTGGVTLTPTTGASPWVYALPLRATGDYVVSLSAPDHRPMSLTLAYGGGSGPTALSVRTPTTGAGWAISRATRTQGGATVTVFTVHLGLRHLWFSAQGRPARRGNALRFLMDGEEAWGAVNTELRATRRTAHLATWWWESEFELVRPLGAHVTSTTAQRRENTILSVLESLPARKRVMVGQFLNMDGTFSTLSTDGPLRAHGTNATDNFEHMGQANPSRGMLRWAVPSFRFGERVRAEVPGASGLTFGADAAVDSELAPRTLDLTSFPTMFDLAHASYHQKFMVLDDRVAFIGGMNLRRVDWDTSQHLVFEPRRMAYTADTAARQRVASRDALPDNGPRKDYMVRIEGPIVRDAEDVFHRRWRYLLDTRARYYDDASDFAVPAPAAPVAGGVQAQVTATLPAPFDEYAIAESWVNAVNQAQNYIYIEDQYWRIPMLNEVIQRRMAAVPGLRLVVITKPVNEWTDPGCYWTYRTHMEFATRFPGRYQLLQLRSFDTQVTWGFDETESRFVDIDTHAKILLVDDAFLSVGSCNKNNRGVFYEGELNVAVLDRTWSRDARRRIVANLLGVAVTAVSDDPRAWYDALAAAARANDAVRARWSVEGDDISLDGRPLPDMYRPRGFVYGFNPGPPRDCLLESIGPDVV